MTINSPAQRMPPGARDRRSARTQAVAWSVSLGLHGLAALMLLGSASGDLMAVSGAGLDQGAMVVSVVPASTLSTVPTGAEQSGDLRPLLAKFANDQAPVEISPTAATPDLDRLFRRLADREPPSQEALRPKPKAAPTTEAMETVETASRAAGEDGRRPGQGAPRSGLPGGLWGVIEPCWRDLPGQSAVPVTLEVALDVGGGMSTPPKILRGRSATVDEPRLQAEARALSALAACLPRSDLRLGGKVYRLDFRPET